MTKSRNIILPRANWTVGMDAELTRRYPLERTEDIAASMGLRMHVVYNRAYALGIKKNREFMASQASGRMQRIDHRGRETQFKTGHATWNKGKPSPTRGRAAETQFKPGAKPPNWRPVGSTRVNVDGYVEIKITEGKFNWRLLHRENWSAANGEIPKGYAVVFKDGNKQNCAIENLECISLQENMKRNTYHNYPKEIAELIQLRGAVTRQIKRRERKQA